MRFAGKKETVTFDLDGDFHRDIRGTKIRFVGDGDEEDSEAAGYMASFAEHQTGKAGDITARVLPTGYMRHPCIEWYSDENGRVVIELDQNQVEVIGQLLPWNQWEPISQGDGGRSMAGGFDMPRKAGMIMLYDIGIR